ncbi:hypothetical protein IEZ26_18260 [Nocardioides cavernae]|uniref:Restriction endonuclease n=1 Tax=Nocardioides cavernae TaxID=1921566 RepID=A0ABR8NEK7_9ACTN|nr:hypothetical protein [Nocardioides cavernae]MBD3926573.1 hypothetical protein [Nocardioides cavernae]MBM7512292.1 hypothetical protein [Nocardioides cavernae]
MKLTGSDLAHALFVTGRAPGDQAKFGDASVWEWLHRSSLVPAYVRRHSSGRLVRSNLALTLDRSEKVALSYALGQAMTAVFCHQVLNVPMLLHVDRYEKRWKVDLGGSNKRPDLFGRLGPAQWVVAEAKGRSNAAESSLPADLVKQKSVVKSVAGHPPVVALGCITSFPAVKAGKPGHMKVNAVDPDADAEGVDIELQDGRYLQAYYEPFARALDGELGVSREGDDFAKRFNNAVTLGLRPVLYELVTTTGGDELARAYDGLDLRPSEEEREAGWRSDGTFVRADWANALALPDYEAEYEAE